MILNLMQIVFNLHKMSKPVFLGQPKNYFNSMMLSAENFTQGPKRKKKKKKKKKKKIRLDKYLG